MTNTFKKMALPVAIASALFASGFASATPTLEATSKVGQELQTANAAQYQNIDLDARYKSEVLFEHKSNMFWGVRREVV